MPSEVGESSHSSTPASQRSCTHQVFLSFRGKDTRKGFTSHLYAALVNRGITTYIDDQLRKGKVISQQLVKAIEESMFAVIVFSRNFASSSWCLDEVVEIVECKEKLGLEIVAVFYHVDPSVVRHQKKTFRKYFKIHEIRYKVPKEKLEIWKAALKEVAGCSSWVTKEYRNDHELVQSIAQHVHKELIRKLPSSMKNLIGIDSRCNKVTELIDKGKDDVRFIGICGMGGVGKTTVASRVWEGIQGEFEASGFFADVKEIFEKEGIVAAQKRLLDCMRLEPIDFSNENDGRRIIHESLCNKKVLLVLDNVDTEVQLQNLANEKSWFGSGSRIIFTSRDTNILHGWCRENEIYMVKELEQNEALQLFCLYAFGWPSPKAEYKDMANEVVAYCDGLPLALKVLGSHLRGRTIDIWRDDILKIKKDLKKDIFCKLKISYDSLDKMERDIFLDIACFFKGMHANFVQTILEHCDHSAKSGIATLIDRSLVTLNENGRLEMHDLLEEMGKQIEIQKSPYDPDMRERLWSAKDADDVLTQEQVSNCIPFSSNN